MCLVSKGEKLLVEKDITLEDFITIKVTPVHTYHTLSDWGGGGYPKLGSETWVPASPLKGGEDCGILTGCVEAEIGMTNATFSGPARTLGFRKQGYEGSWVTRGCFLSRCLAQQW